MANSFMVVGVCGVWAARAVRAGRVSLSHACSQWSARLDGSGGGSTRQSIPTPTAWQFQSLRMFLVGGTSPTIIMHIHSTEETETIGTA